MRLPAPPEESTGPAVGSSLSARAYRELRDRLILLDIAPGEPIHESHLMAELGLGRTPLREALKQLERDHLVVSYPRRGTFATTIDITELSKISEVRSVLEPFAARRAAEKRGGAVRGEIELLVPELSADSLARSGSRRDLMLMDMRIHRLVHLATGNDYLAETLGRYADIAARIWCVSIDRLTDLTAHIAEHADLLEQILDGDAEGAEATSAEHVAHFERALRAAL